MAEVYKAPKMRIEGAQAEGRAAHAETARAPRAEGVPKATRAKAAVETPPAAEPTVPLDEGSAGRGSQEADATTPRLPSGDGRAWTGWLTRYFPGHEHAAAGALCGLLVALLVFAIGFFRTLLILLLVVGGIAIGQFFDGDPHIVSFVRQVIAAWRR